MLTKRRRVKISQFLPRISYIEIQGRRANDIKHSASWEATQVFLNFVVSSSIGYFQQFLVSSCAHDQCFCLFVYFRTRKCGCRSYSVFNARNEVYTWRVLEKVG